LKRTGIQKSRPLKNAARLYKEFPSSEIEDFYHRERGEHRGTATTDHSDQARFLIDARIARIRRSIEDDALRATRRIPLCSLLLWVLCGKFFTAAPNAHNLKRIESSSRPANPASRLSFSAKMFARHVAVKTMHWSHTSAKTSLRVF
jgi:hypothetical protein